MLDVEKSVAAGFRNLHLKKSIKPGKKIGIAVGSRGIAGLTPAVKTAVDEIKTKGAYPYIVAAMGSHGGGTKEGQIQILNDLGITENSIGAPILAEAESIELGKVKGTPLYVNSLAFEFDSLIIINRVKPHTSFRGEIESGLIKMLVAGLGGIKGAEVLHEGGSEKIPEKLVELGQELVKKLPILDKKKLVGIITQTDLLKIVSIKWMLE
ncbi:MAG: lactate racemase domain-containing protein [Nanoarchaeota archaeon]